MLCYLAPHHALSMLIVGPLLLESWYAKIAFTWGPTYVSNSQHGGKVSTFELQEINKIWLIIIEVRSWLFYAIKLGDLCKELVYVFCSIQLSTHISNLISNKCCHVGIHVIFGTSYLRSHVKWKIPVHALNGWDCADWPQVTWDLGLGTLREPRGGSVLKS